MANLRKQSGERKEIAVTKVLCYVLCDQIDRNLWGEGAVKHETYRKEYEEKEGLWDPSGRNELVRNYLFWFSKGCAHFEAYLKGNCMSRINMLCLDRI